MYTNGDEVAYFLAASGLRPGRLLLANAEILVLFQQNNPQSSLRTIRKR